MADDREVWKKISRGDEDAFDAFYRENVPGLCSFLRQITSSLSVAEDLAQETFTQIWNRPNGFNPDRGSLRGYLFGIGRKQALEWWRHQRPTESETEAKVETPRTELCTAIGEALGHLPEDQRALLWLREVEGQSYGELAAILEIPIGTVRSRLFTAREALRNIWQEVRKQR